MRLQAKGHSKVKMGKTAVIKKTRTPTWSNEVFELVLPEPHKMKGSCVIVEVFDKDLTGRGDFLGRVVLQASVMVMTRRHR